MGREMRGEARRERRGGLLFEVSSARKGGGGRRIVGSMLRASSGVGGRVDRRYRVACITEERTKVSSSSKDTGEGRKGERRKRELDDSLTSERVGGRSALLDLTQLRLRGGVESWHSPFATGDGTEKEGVKRGE